MSEGTEATSVDAADPVAVTVALASASREKADAFLDDQRRLIGLQAKELAHELELRHWSLLVRHLSGLLKLTLEVSVALIALALVCGVGVMVWNAAHAEGYVIESFAVPPDMAARGLTGEVVASRLLDRLNVVQTPPPNSVAAAQTLTTSSSDDVKVEIPDTGISFGELYRFLRRWLGHEIHVSGEVVRQDQGVTVAIRINGKDGATYQGSEADFDVLLQKAAEHVFGTVQPNLYANWMMSLTPKREAEAQVVYHRVINDPATTPRLRAQAWNALAVSASLSGDLYQARTLYQRAVELDPTYALGFNNLVLTDALLSRPEAALALVPRALTVLENNHGYWSPEAFALQRTQLHVREADFHGDYLGAVAELQESAPMRGGGSRQYAIILAIASDRARLHDGLAAAWLAQQQQPSDAVVGQGLGLNRITRPLQIETALEHWTKVIAVAAETEKALAQARLSDTGREVMSALQLRPWLALAKARTGDIAGAQELIAKTPDDCYDCMRSRGMIASEARQWGRADHWFAKGVYDAPSIPFAYEDWGRSELARGQPDAAIEKFRLSNHDGPHFADPLEGWGEALMAKNRSDLALAKFAEAGKYAPNWGRLHLKWGEALYYAGKKDEAAAHFARAAQLDLTPPEKSELAGFGHG
jgi:tetratricopeptide (TPR) repeat protein